MSKFFALLLIVAVFFAGYWIYEKTAVEEPAPSVMPDIQEANGEATTTPLAPAIIEQAKEANTKADVNKINDKKIMNATLHTSMGDITIELDQANKPNTVANFIKLAKAGFYDDTKFHRVIKGFMNQGGDPLSKDDTKMDLWGTGGPDYRFADELGAPNSNDAGTIAMANSGPNTNGSQFFINAVPNHFLDTKHTVFGKVVSGMDVVTAINNIPTGANDRPVKPVVLKGISLK
jgi:peptidylprolyl isomerase